LPTGKKCRLCIVLRDAQLGKMLQADPVVQDPNTSQSFNRYSYVHNNPLSFTDPTGYFSLRQLLAAVVFIAVSIFATPLGPFFAGFLAGFSSSLILTGNLKTALKAGLIAGAIAFAAPMPLRPARPAVKPPQVAQAETSLKQP